MTLPQRVSLVTLGVADLPRARAFYARLGWREHAESQPGIAFFQLHGQALALFPMDALAADQGRPDAALGLGGATLAQNFATRAEVDAAYAEAIAVGGVPLKPPAEVFWGGYSGYWADLDGHVWEVALNPFWPLAVDGSLVLPGGVEQIAEMALSAADEAAIADLLARCFDTDFGGRSFFRSRHHLRLVIRQGGQIIAHMAVQFRAVRLGQALVDVALLAEVATHPDHRGKGLAAQLLRHAIDASARSRASHLLLFGTAALYAGAGFRPVANPLVYLDLDGARTGGLCRAPADHLMALALGPAPWDETAELDLMGGLF